jgi:flagellar hook assembly protein FlgD
VWIQKDYAALNSEYRNISVNLTDNQLGLYSGAKNSVLDLKDVSEIRIYFDSDSGEETGVLFLDDLTFYPANRSSFVANDTLSDKNDSFVYAPLGASGINLLGIDSVSPNITELKIDAKEIVVGDYVKNLPLVTAKALDTGSGVATWNIYIINAENDVVILSEEGNGASVVNTAVDISFQTSSALSDGRYFVKIEAQDKDGNLQSLISNEFNVVTDFKITELGNFPNPFNPNNEATKIEYQLTKEADVSIYIYSISGEKLWQQKMGVGEPGTMAGYNKIEWDGINNFGEVVANGPYIAYVVAKSGSDKRVGKRKLLVLK